jgi:hypothetical protein
MKADAGTGTGDLKRWVRVVAIADIIFSHSFIPKTQPRRISHVSFKLAFDTAKFGAALPRYCALAFAHLQAYFRTL